MKHRRKFIISALRCTGLLLLGGGSLVLARRGGCGRTNPCGTCPLFSGCGLDKARESGKSNNPQSHAGKTI